MKRDPHYMAQRSPKRSKLRAASYAAMYPALVRVARRLGYALAIHGSAARDFDIVAVPWTRFARPADELVEAIRECSGGTETASATEKAHGRIAHTIYFGSGAWLDLSVMPRTAPFYESKRRGK